MSEEYDIVIVGAGPTGLMLAASITRMGSYKVKIIDNRPERTDIGRADGIQARSLDILRNMGLKRQFMAYDPGRIYEVAFWNASGKKEGGIRRSGTWKSYPDFIDTRYPFTTILHQGRIEKIFLDDLAKNDVLVDRPWTISSFKKDGEDATYPIEVQLHHIDGELKSTVRTKYVFGADGARSFVRKQLGIKMIHKDPIVHVWSVIDGVVRTNFPDIQIKCTVHSENGSAMIIPHGNNVVRVYVQIVLSGPEQDYWKVAPESKVKEVANDILSPYYIEWERVDWYSVYPIGQGIAERYSLDERIFIGGDACHTHSAGQGMNFGFLDAQNFAWKFHLVEAGFAKRSILKTYEQERLLVAQKLIDFDAKYAKLFSSRIPSTDDVKDAVNSIDHSEFKENNEFVRYYKQSSEFTSGYGVDYGLNCLNLIPAKSRISAPSRGYELRPGLVFPLATVTRVVDARVVDLEQEIPQNGSYRIFLFAGNPITTRRAISDFAAFLQEKKSLFSVYARHDVTVVPYRDRHNPHSMFFTFCFIFNAPRVKIDVSEVLPDVLVHYSYHVYADDIQTQGAAHAKLGIDQDKGAVVIVRPDGFVGCSLPLAEGPETVEALNEYFAAITTKPLGNSAVNLEINTDA